MSKQLEGLCPHDRLLTAYCPKCAIEGELYQPNFKVETMEPVIPDPLTDEFGSKQIDWKRHEEKHAEFDAGLTEDITAQSILQQAIDCMAERAPFRDTNGEKSIALGAKIFNVLMGTDLTEYDACIFFACVKLARSQRGQFHVDDYIDAASYIGMAGESRAGAVRPTGNRPEVGEDMPETWIP